MLGRRGTWVQVRVPERNLVGWVAGRYLESIYPVGSLPLVSE